MMRHLFGILALVIFSFGMVACDDQPKQKTRADRKADRAAAQVAHLDYCQANSMVDLKEAREHFARGEFVAAQVVANKCKNNDVKGWTQLKAVSNAAAKKQEQVYKKAHARKHAW